MIQSSMLDIARIALILGLIIFLLREGVKIGHVLLISALAVVIFYGMDASGVVFVVKKAATERISIMLLLSLSLIRIFKLVLREEKILSHMMGTIKSSFNFRKAVMISMPVHMGMLPSLGCAYFSAPMVREATEGTGMGNEEKAFINYWFRHPRELSSRFIPALG